MNKINVYIFITGTCMYLSGRNSVLNDYNCSRFRHGCPNSSYFTDEVYNCNLFEIYNIAMVLFCDFTDGWELDFSQVHVAYNGYMIIHVKFTSITSSMS